MVKFRSAGWVFVALLVCCAAVGADDGLTMVPATMKAGHTMKPQPTRTLASLAGLDATPVELDQYGGCRGQAQPATGFFYPKNIGQRWWLIDPDGNRFVHIAVAATGPQRGPGFAKSSAEKFGPKGAEAEQRWLAATVAMLVAAGFNGTGAWSDDTLIRAAGHRLVYTPILNLMGNYGRQRGGVYQQPGHLGYPENCIFAFDPEFAAYVDQQAGKLAANKDDPWLLGYFSDNELPFPADALEAFLKLPQKDAGHQAAAAWLAARPGGSGKAISAEDREAFRGYVAERYFSICAAAIKKYDPHHLYLGSRFHGGARKSAALFAAAGKSLDVISVNVYGNWSPRQEIEQQTRWSGRPILVTEWYAKGQDSGMKNTTGAGWTVPTQADRGKFYQNFTLDLLESRSCVGWHWFKYADNDPEDKASDPSNRDSNKGVVNIHYEPYAPLLSAMTALNRTAYSAVDFFDRSMPIKAGRN